MLIQIIPLAIERGWAMQFKKFGNKYVVRIDKGEEIVATLKQFCIDQNIKLGTVSGIGATNQATIGLFLTESKSYQKKQMSGDMELAPLMGNISTMAGEIYLHIHANLCDSENRSYSGHLNEAICSATFEAVIDSIDGEVDREFSDEIGLNLFKFEEK